MTQAHARGFEKQLLSVISLLSSDTPNLDSPANIDAAKQVRGMSRLYRAAKAGSKGLTPRLHLFVPRVFRGLGRLPQEGEYLAFEQLGGTSNLGNRNAEAVFTCYRTLFRCDASYGEFLNGE